ncbi:hypothetical protein [Desulfonema ishimotonii]|uniref:hypothetical protein n=1 Tax=Desulfonema ishimotonii TaxID=45657 RepID=UPI000F5767DE|nr:hypothetical protein [Desulfonema ishimotonii]
MAFYAALQSANFQPTTITPTSWNGTRGKVIMEQFARSGAPMPFTEDRIAVVMDLAAHRSQRGRGRVARPVGPVG